MRSPSDYVDSRKSGQKGEKDRLGVLHDGQYREVTVNKGLGFYTCMRAHEQTISHTAYTAMILLVFLG